MSQQRKNKNRQRSRKQRTGGISRPLNTSSLRRYTQPRQRSTRTGTIVTHSNLLTFVTAGTESFNIAQYPLNPGLSASFKWLNRIAVAYEFYRFRKLRVVYDNSASATVTGRFLAYIDYDAKDQPAASYADAASMSGHVRCSPWEKASMAAKPGSMHRAQGQKKYVRSDGVAITGDITLYDVGNLFLCTVPDPSAPADQIWGEVWLEYEIEFFSPQTASNVAPPPVQSTELTTTYTLENDVLGLPNSTFYPFQGVEPGEDQIGLGSMNGAGSVLIPAGKYLVRCMADGVTAQSNQLVSNLRLGPNGDGSDPAVDQTISTSVDDIYTGDNHTQTGAETWFDIPVPSWLTAQNVLSLIAGGTSVDAVISAGTSLVLKYFGLGSITAEEFKLKQEARVRREAKLMASLRFPPRYQAAVPRQPRTRRTPRPDSSERVGSDPVMVEKLSPCS